jgi:rubrerythrin
MGCHLDTIVKRMTENEGNKAALISFRNANAVEKTHHELYSKALEALEAGNICLPASEIPTRNITPTNCSQHVPATP